MRETRKMRAAELMRLATGGPSTSWVFSELPDTKAMRHAEEYAAESYRIWSQTWLLPLLRELVPELKEPSAQRPYGSPITRR